MFLRELGSGSRQPPTLQTSLPLADAFTAMPILSRSAAPSSKCFSSLWTGPVVVAQGVSWGKLVPPAAWGWFFFLNTARKELAECSCHGSGYEEGRVVPWKWLTLALREASCKNSFAMRLHKPGSVAGEGSPASLPPSAAAMGSHTQSHARSHALPPLARFRVGRVGVLAAHRVLMPRVPGDGPPRWHPLAWLNLSTPPRPGTQTIVLDQPAPICFSLVRRARPGQPACSHTSLGSLGAVTAL